MGKTNPSIEIKFTFRKKAERLDTIEHEISTGRNTNRTPSKDINGRLHCPGCDCIIREFDDKCWSCKLEFELPAGVTVEQWKAGQQRERNRL